MDKKKISIPESLPEGIPEGSRPVILLDEDGNEADLIWIGPNFGKIGMMVMNPNGVQRLTITGRFSPNGGIKSQAPVAAGSRRSRFR